MTKTMRTAGVWLWIITAVRHFHYAHGYQFENTTGENGHCQTNLTNQLIKSFGWETVVFLHNEQGKYAVNEMEQGVLGVKILLYCADPDDLENSLLDIHGNLFPNINIVLSGTASFIKDILVKADQFDESTSFITDFRHHSTWLVLTADDSVIDVDKDIAVLENIVVIISNETSPADGVAMTLRHHPAGNVFTPVAACGADVSLCYFPNVRYGYNNRHIRVMTLPKPNFVIREELNERVSYTGYVLDILQIASRKLNFSYSISEPDDRSWGLLRNGTWDGIVHHLIEHKCDLAASDLAITKDRASVVDYIYPPINSDGVGVLYMTHLPSPFWTLVQPLCWEVYLVILAVTAAVVFMFRCIENHQRVANKGSGCGSDLIVRALFRQGALTGPTSGSGKVFLSFWWLFLIVVAGIYSGNLAASFSSPQHIHPFKTYQELSNTDFTLLLDVVGITYSNFMKIDLPVLQDLRKKIIRDTEEPIELSIQEKLKKVREDRYALLTYSTSAELYRVEHCGLELLSENLFYEHVAFAVPKQSTMKDDLEKIMWNLHESGMLDTLWRRWYRTRNSTACMPDQDVKPVSSSMLSGGFLSLLVGTVLATAVLCVERLSITQNSDTHPSPASAVRTWMYRNIIQ